MANMKCLKCEMTFVTQTLQEYHMTTSHKIASRSEIKCVMCDFKSKTKTQFILHMESQTTEKPKPAAGRGNHGM